MKIKEILNVMKTSNIQYKLYGENKMHTFNMLNYLFFKRKVFKNKLNDDDKSKYLVKDTVEFIRFSNFFNYYSFQKRGVVAEDNTKVEIYEENLGGPLLIKATNIKLNVKNNLISLSSAIIDSNFVKIRGGFLEICEASKTYIYDYDINNMLIESNELEILHAPKICNKLYHRGRLLLIRNINSAFCEIDTSATEISICNSFIKGEKLNIVSCNNPKIINSFLFFEKSIKYGNGSLGSNGNGIFIDDNTFREDVGLELKRANLSYILKELLKKVESEKIEQMIPYLSAIDKRINYLMEQYEIERQNLEKEKSMVRDFYNDSSVKSLIKKK